MNAIDNLGKVLLIIQICQLEYESLDSMNSVVYRHIRGRFTYLREANLSHVIKKDVDVVRMTKIQFRCLNEPS